MTESMDAAPAPESSGLAARVLAVAGVTELFASRSAVARLPHAVTSLVTKASDDADLVKVVRAGDASHIEVRVGTKLGARTPDSARQVADALLDEIGHSAGTVKVQIARIG